MTEMLDCQAAGHSTPGSSLKDKRAQQQGAALQAAYVGTRMRQHAGPYSLCRLEGHSPQPQRQTLHWLRLRPAQQTAGAESPLVRKQNSGGVSSGTAVLLQADCLLCHTHLGSRCGHDLGSKGGGRQRNLLEQDDHLLQETGAGQGGVSWRAGLARVTCT